jgi:hypothetical protein
VVQPDRETLYWGRTEPDHGMTRHKLERIVNKNVVEDEATGQAATAAIA